MDNTASEHSVKAAVFSSAAFAGRVRLLRGLPGFTALPGDALARLAALLVPVSQEAGTVIVREGETGDRLFLIENGDVEATADGPQGPIPLSLLRAGEWFGEIALLEGDGLRQASVTALTPVRLLALSKEDFQEALAQEPALTGTWRQAAEAMLRAKFLKQASPFACLSPDQARELAARLRERAVGAGEVILRQGEPGRECFLVRRGEVAVVLEDGTPEERLLSTLGPGSLFGEMALLTESPRSATVRAIQNSELWVLAKEDLAQIIDANATARLRLAELFHYRDRPRQSPGVLAYEQKTADGPSLHVLKHPALHAYYRLSVEGWLAWGSLDGRHSVRDLILEDFRVFRRFAPGFVLSLLQDLAQAGFIQAGNPSFERAGASPVSLWRKLASLSGRILTVRATLSGCNPWMERLYRDGVWLAYTLPARGILAALALAGLAVFLLCLTRGQVAITADAWSGGMLAFLLGANAVSIVLHEAGHAFTCKHYGREVDRVGIGWYWVGPVAFVDTSDMWLMPKGPRIAVSLAGVFANMACAGLAAIAAWGLGGGPWAAVLWQFVLVSYGLVLLNLNPLLEYDGYYVLMDWLERPDLRRKALSWLAEGLPGALVHPGRLRGHAVELGYALATALYVLAMGGLLLAACRLSLEPWLAGWLPSWLAAVLAWTPATGLLVLSLIQLAGEVRADKRQ